MDPAALAHLAAAAALDQQYQQDAPALQSMLAQTTTHHASAGALGLSQLLAQLPATPPGLGLSPSASSPQQQQLQLHHASSTGSLQFDAQTAADAWMLQAAAASGTSSPTTTLPLEQLHAGSNGGGPRVFVPDSLKQTVAGSTPPNSQHQLLLQAALGQQQQQPAMPDAVNMLQEQLLLQALQQQQQQASQPNLQAALLAALSAGAPATPPGLAQQPLAGANMWPYLSPPGLAANTPAATAAAATAAALLAAQQQQQQAVLTQALASSADTTTALLQQLLLGQQGLAGMPGAPATAGVLNQLQPWAVKALATQMQQQGAALNAAALNQLASLLNTSAAGSAGHTGHRTGGVQGRRRSGRRSSGTAAAGADLPGSFSGFAATSRANSIAGSDMAELRGSSTGLPAVLPAGVLASDLCPTKYEDNWGGSTDAPAPAAEGAAPATTSVTSDDSYQLARNSSSASTSSIESSAGASACGSALSLSSSGCAASGEAAGPDADGKWQWNSHFCSLEGDDTTSQGSSGVPGQACRKAAAAAAKQAAAAGDDTQVSKDQAPAAGTHKAKVWIPGQREAAGDDSWYLPRPPTCRLFVGNIGCWVDEAMLLAYFGQYGHVVDVQVGVGNKHAWLVLGWSCGCSAA